jgi:Zn-dependent protease with chaperone function
MATTGAGTFYDGLTSARHDVAVALNNDVVSIAGENGATLAMWPTVEIAPVSTPEGILRVGLAHRPTTARLEIHDPELAAAIVKAALPCDRTGLTDHHTRTRVVAYSLLAIVVLIGAAIWGVPLIAGRIVPLLPIAVDQRLGAVANPEVRRELAGKTGGKPLECSAGTNAQARAARAAFAKLVGLLEGAAGLPLPTQVTAVHINDVNAITLPGGFIYVYAGLLANANRVDEVAAVIGHEMGHVDHRDGTKTVVEAGGLSVLFGLLLGDFTGGGAVVLTATKLLSLAYSRQAEAAADQFGAELMAKIGGDPHALGEFLVRLASDTKPTEHFLLDHPEAKVRDALIDRVPQPSPMRALLTAQEWSALKGMCKE